MFVIYPVVGKPLCVFPPVGMFPCDGKPLRVFPTVGMFPCDGKPLRVFPPVGMYMILPDSACALPLVFRPFIKTSL